MKINESWDPFILLERREMEQEQAIIFARREAKFRLQQQAELQALLKRIECRRKEHIKQRNLDTKRLLQRNRNVQAVLEAKQAAECQKAFSDIKKLLYSNAVLTGIPAPSMNSSLKGNKKAGNNNSNSQQQLNANANGGSPARRQADNNNSTISSNRGTSQYADNSHDSFADADNGWRISFA